VVFRCFVQKSQFSYQYEFIEVLDKKGNFKKVETQKKQKNRAPKTGNAVSLEHKAAKLSLKNQRFLERPKA
jgi:hypothetical protein